MTSGLPLHSTADAPTAGAAALRIRLLGGFRVELGARDRAPIAEAVWRRKAASLVKLLALAPEYRLHREQVQEALWPELEPGAAANNLHRTLYLARQTLAAAHAPAATSPYLCLRRDQLALGPTEAIWTDVRAFEVAALAARRGADPAAHEAALALYAGDLLPEDRYEDWATGRREELRALYLGLLAELARLHEGRGEYPAAVAALERLVASEPADEEAHAALMRLYALAGRRQQALRQYQRLREVLRRDLDAEPTPATRRLYEEIAADREPARRSRAAGPAAQGDAAPALAAGPDAPAPPTNLPSQLTSFVGREHELTEVARLLGSTRLLTLTGAGGCGKTRLALEAAARALPAYPDGVWLVELAALADAERVPGAVASALGVREEPGRSLVETLIGFLRPKSLLLVLDNCEHLAAACAGLANTLLRACPRLRLLSTSRAPLSLAGETVWPVPPLSTPDLEPLPGPAELLAYDAVRLFVERASSISLGFSLTPQNAPAVVQVCRRLEGLALALELAAARTKVLGVEQIAARLDDALHLLTRGNQPTPRHQTLRATLDWSHALLGQRERIVFRRLAVFAGGCTLEAAEAIASDEPRATSDERGTGQGGEQVVDARSRGPRVSPRVVHPPTGSGPSFVARDEVLDLLAELADQSLLVVSSEGGRARYRLLESVRQYAAEQLRAAGEEARTRSRHLAWCVALAEEAEPGLMGPEQGAWLARLEGEHDNLRAALGWALESAEPASGARLAAAMWRFWWVHGHLSEGRRWQDLVLAASVPPGGAPVPAAVRAKVLNGAGVLAWSQGDLAAARAFHEESLALRREVGEQKAIAGSLANLGVVAHLEGEYERASALYEESLALARELGDRYTTGNMLNNLAVAERDRGNYERASALLEECLALRRELGDEHGIAKAVANLGIVALYREDYQRAAGLHRESLTQCQQLGSKEGIAYCLEGLAAVAGAWGQAERAARLFGVAEALREATGWPLPRAEQAHHARLVAAARAQLPEPAFVAAWAAGRALPLDRAVAEALDEGPFAPTIARATTAPAVAGRDTPLTPREREVAALVAHRLTSRQIAAELGLAERTVDTHVNRILHKLGLNSRTQIAAWLQSQRAPAVNPG